MVWITFIGMIILPILGFVINQLVTKKIDDANRDNEKVNERIDALEKQREEDKRNIYGAINGQRGAFENSLKDYVRKDLYDQAMELHRLNNDEKFKSLLSVVVTQGNNLEAKIEGYNKNMNDKINDLKILINDLKVSNNGNGNGKH